MLPYTQLLWLASNIPLVEQLDCPESSATCFSPCYQQMVCFVGNPEHREPQVCLLRFGVPSNPKRRGGRYLGMNLNWTVLWHGAVCPPTIFEDVLQHVAALHVQCHGPLSEGRRYIGFSDKHATFTILCSFPNVLIAFSLVPTGASPSQSLATCLFAVSGKCRDLLQIAVLHF